VLNIVWIWNGTGTESGTGTGTGTGTPTVINHYGAVQVGYLIPVWIPGEGANVELALRGDKMANAASLHIPHTQVTLNKNNASLS
jgi:hypothetical protein